jgi:uncharacterized phage protein (TIGR02220 family)
MMADWRKLYSKICENLELGECSLGANLLFERLLIKTDDEGRFYGESSLINKLVFTARQDVKNIQISKWLLELSNKNLIKLYEIDGKKYLFFYNFHKYQQLRKDIKPKISFPDPPVTDTERPVTDTERPVDIRVEESRGEEIQKDVTEFFSYFLLKTKKDFKMNEERQELISKRLKKGFTLEQLKLAVDNFVQDDWEGRAKSMDLVYCIGIRNKVDNLEKWLNYKPKEIKPTIRYG